MPTYSSTRDLQDGLDVKPQFSRDGAVVDIPRRRMAEESVDPETAYHVIKDELMLDGHSRLNVATFGTTWMEPQAEMLMAEAADVNIVDRDEYPQTAQLEDRCLDIIADEMDEFEVIADGSDLPVIAFCFKGANTKTGKPRRGSYADKVDFTLSDVADWMKQGGWAVPA